MNKITAVVLAGGVGKRFWPITTDKSLLSFIGKPLIAHTLEAIKSAGVKNIVVVANPFNKKAIKKIQLKSTEIKVVLQEKPKGMRDAVLTAEDLIKNDSILIVNASDIVENQLFAEVVKKAKENKSQVLIPGIELKEYFPGGYLRLKKGKVVEIVEKPKEGTQPSNLMNLVVHYYKDSNQLLAQIKSSQSQRDDAYEKGVTNIIKGQGATLIRYKGYWEAVKFPWHILDMTKLFLTHRLEPQNKAIKIAKSASVDKNVFLGKGVKVLENAVIKGPSFIGDNTVIGTNALILHSMIGKGCMVGFASEVTRSYLGDNCWLHTNYVGDSVLEGDNYFGAGAVTANFRFDEGSIHSTVKEERVDSKRNKFGAIIGQAAKVGVNASLMPGVKIGAGATVGPGVVQYQDVGSGDSVLLDSRKALKVKGKKKR
jgi:bifunctional UDP-N-acetylglucosamine pyrophosphorylase/glucosamine-1-phosphate N-acetyltransferase